MKLVQLLANELKEWPEGVTHLTQSEVDNEIYNALEGNSEGALDSLDHRFDTSSSHSERPYPIVSREQWQAEREKMNKPKWILHRGGNRPIEDNLTIEIRWRDGEVGVKRSGNVKWKHEQRDYDIMAYRVIEETKDQEIEEVITKHMALGCASKEEMVSQIGEECPFAQVASAAKYTNFGTITYKLEIDATEATKEIDSLVAKWGQIESPLKWRDAIIHCQAIIEDCEREIQRNVNLLDAEGLMMQKDSKKAMQYYQTDIDMSDWRNWQIGDRVCATKNFDDADIGDELIITRLDHADEEQPIGMSTGSSATYWPEMNWVKFVRRP